MPVSADFRDFVLDQLSNMQFDQRSMFGGVGLFQDGLMFAIIPRSDTLFFKTDEVTVGDYESLGARPFTFERNGVQRTMGGYYEVPAELLEDPDELVKWAERAVAVASRAKVAGTPKRRKVR